MLSGERFGIAKRANFKFACKDCEKVFASGVSRYFDNSSEDETKGPLCAKCCKKREPEFDPDVLAEPEKGVKGEDGNLMRSILAGLAELKAATSATPAGAIIAGAEQNTASREILYRVKTIETQVKDLEATIKETQSQVKEIAAQLQYVYDYVVAKDDEPQEASFDK